MKMIEKLHYGDFHTGDSKIVILLLQTDHNVSVYCAYMKFLVRLVLTYSKYTKSGAIRDRCIQEYVWLCYSITWLCVMHLKQEL